MTVHCTFDALDRLASMDDGARTFSYDSNGNVHNMTVRDPNNTLTGGVWYAIRGRRPTNPLGRFAPLARRPRSPPARAGSLHASAGGG
ncbi:MAG TPA: hypothetical protein VFQ25_07890 [Ktedonobacterales bacterium]|nr:hypothetical protein [Ktedonobacterales bacterium]